MPATAKPAKPFADLTAALDALDAGDLTSDIQEAIDDINNAASVETMRDFAQSLASADAMLVKVLERVRALHVRTTHPTLGFDR